MIAIWGFAPAITEPGVLMNLIRNSKPIDQYVAELKQRMPFAFAPDQPPTPNEPGQSPTVPGTPATPQPKDPTEGGSVGPEHSETPLGTPQKNPDPGLKPFPTKGPALPPVVPEIPQ